MTMLKRWKLIKNESKYVTIASDTESNFESAFKYFKDNNIIYYGIFGYYIDLVYLFKTGKIKIIDSKSEETHFAFMHSDLDHMRFYKSKDGKVFLVCHNYDMGKTSKRLIDWCYKHAFNLEKLKESWYHSSTSTYVITLRNY